MNIIKSFLYSENIKLVYLIMFQYTFYTRMLIYLIYSSQRGIAILRLNSQRIKTNPKFNLRIIIERTTSFKDVSSHFGAVPKWLKGGGLENR